jgi:hypothetical protein
MSQALFGLTQFPLEMRHVKATNVLRSIRFSSFQTPSYGNLDQERCSRTKKTTSRFLRCGQTDRSAADTRRPKRELAFVLFF